MYSPEALSKPPVVEAIYGIHCITPESLDQPSVMLRLREALPGGYTLQETMDRFNIELKRDADGGPIQPSHTQLWSGAKLTSNDGQVVAHFMRFGVFISFLAYRSFEEARPVVQGLWESYSKAFDPVLVNKLSIRYINLIRLPFEEGRVDLERYFKVNLKFPDDLTSTMDHFHQQFVIRDPETQVPARVMISNVREEDGHLVVVFDQEGYQERQWSPDDPILWGDFELIRNWTYHIFRATLTEECLKKFND